MVTLTIGRRHSSTHASFEDAQAEYVRLRNESGEGASTWPEGKTCGADGHRFRISYNGDAVMDAPPLLTVRLLMRPDLPLEAFDFDEWVEHYREELIDFFRQLYPDEMTTREDLIDIDLKGPIWDTYLAIQWDQQCASELEFADEVRRMA